MAIVQAKLDEAQAEFDKAMAHKQALEDDAAATQKKMDSANALIGALAGEEARWSAQSKEFDQTIQQLTGMHHCRLQCRAHDETMKKFMLMPKKLCHSRNACD